MIKIKKLSFLLPPVLVAVFPILSFYLNNISELSLKFIGKPLLYSITASAMGTLLLLALTRNRNKTSLIIFFFVLIFFSYGRVSKSFNNILFIQLPRNIVLGPDKILLPITVIIFVIFSFIILKSAKSLNQAIGFLNISLLILVGYLSYAVVKRELKRNYPIAQPVSLQDKTPIVQENKSDIYYIILDGYAREDVLKEIYNYDNFEFITGLKNMGFYIADSARSNYLHTYLSLPSSLNMRYLDDLPQKYGVNPTDDSAARQLTSDNEVTKKLKHNGYTIINFATLWQGTGEEFKADVTYKKENYYKILGNNLALNETTITFLQTTLFSPFIREVLDDVFRARTLAALQNLPTVSSSKGNKFVIAHLLVPHPPYVFTAEGNPVPGAEFEFADEGVDKRPKYLAQLTFISNQIIPVLQKIINNSQNPPIIILQSDHGPGSIFGQRDNWLKNYSEEGVKERSSILYAVYLPDRNYQKFYESITPVNTFRIIFNNYFNDNLPLLPDKTFYTSYESIYGFKDVTGIK